MRRIILSICFLSLLSAPPLRAEERLLVFAASSLQTALDQAVTRWKARGGTDVAVSYAATSALARQIEAGAPADLFFAASDDWIAYLDQQGLIQPHTRHDLLGNQLALIQHGTGTDHHEINKDFDFKPLLGDEYLAIAGIKTVPAGIYAEEALVSLELWDDVKTQLAQADSARAALALVALGEARFGIVYRTDALAEPKVSTLGLFPTESHSPITYPLAIPAESTHPDAQAFLAFLMSDDAKDIFQSEGFSWLLEN